MGVGICFGETFSGMSNAWGHTYGSRQVVQKENKKEPPPPNPNPSKYKILKKKIVGKFLVVEIAYDGCTNYEGKKILVFKDVSYQKLMEQQSIDPHFSENKDLISPIARFEPTKRGWKLAISFASI